MYIFFLPYNANLVLETIFQLFEKYLLIRERNKVKEGKEGGDDEVNERQISANIKLFSYVISSLLFKFK